VNNTGGNRASTGASLGPRLVVLGAAAGALGYAVVYFFDPLLGEERRRRVVEAAHAAVHEVVLLSHRLVAGVPELQPGLEPEPARAPEPSPAAVTVVEAPPAYHALTPEPEMRGALRDKVTFFRLGEDDGEEAPVLVAPVAVIAEELPIEAGRQPAYDPPPEQPSLAPTIIAYDADRQPEPEPEPEPVAAAATRRSGRTLLAAAAVVALLAAAAALGGWAIWSRGDSNQAAPPVSSGASQAISLISQPGARRVPVRGSNGHMVLVVTRTGQAVLIVSGVKGAPPGKVYQAWIVTGKTPHSAGLFKGGGAQLVIPLQQKLPKRAIFAITVERAGGAPAPTEAPEFTAKLS
jgi:Anti-sigma-K factor rskA, C-terminal